MTSAVKRGYPGKVKTGSLTSFLLLWVLLLSACGKDVSAPVVKLSGDTMGTTYHITLVANPAEVDSAVLKQKIDARLLGINQSMSTYIPDSELMQLNAAALEQPVPVSAELFEVLQISREVYELSAGRFDITVGPLVDLWGFGPSVATHQVPETALIDAARQRVGFDQVDLDREQRTLLRHKAVSMDLSAVAKGYAVDKIADLIAAEGFSRYMVEIGGEIRVAGLSPRDTPWRIGVERPDPQGLEQVAERALELGDMAVATSGDYRNYFEVDGQRFSHTIDPLTGQPINHRTASVTVLDRSCGRADALATAFNVLGADEGLALANRHGIPVYFLVKSSTGFTEVVSEAFKPYLD